MGRRKNTTESETVQDAMKIQTTPEKDLKKLLGRVKTHETTKNEAVSAMGGAISDAVEKKFLDKKAFAQARREERMDPEKLAIFYFHLESYRKNLGLYERAKRQMDMFEEAGEEVGEQEPAGTTTRKPRLAVDNGDAEGEQPAA